MEFYYRTLKNYRISIFILIFSNWIQNLLIASVFITSKTITPIRIVVGPPPIGSASIREMRSEQTLLLELIRGRKLNVERKPVRVRQKHRWKQVFADGARGWNLKTLRCSPKPPWSRVETHSVTLSPSFLYPEFISDFISGFIPFTLAW